MDTGIVHLNEMRNLDRVLAGMRGGPFFRNSSLTPPLNFVDGYPPELTQKFQAKAIKQPTPIDGWNARRK